MQACPFTRRFCSLAVVSLAAVAFVTVSPAAHAQKHESNTIKKLGHKVARGTHKAAKATEYGVRKSGEAVNVTTHRALNKNSVVRDRAHKKNYIEKPGGTKVFRNKGNK